MAKLCGFERAWTHPCNNPKAPGEPVCEKHTEKKCWCGEQAVKECSTASSFVCGAPLCVDHECRNVAAGLTGSVGYPHSKNGLAQYKEWKGKQDG